LIILDTDVLIEIFDRNSDIGGRALESLDGLEIGTSSINLHEIAYGFSRIGEEVPSELTSIRILEYDREDALLSSKIESELEREGKGPGRFDAMIASICINSGSQIATLNRRHFERFGDHGLRIFDL